MKSGAFTNFRTAYCMRYACVPASFERRMLWGCMHQRAILLARLIYMVYPGFFKKDLDVIREMGKAMRAADVEELLKAFRELNESRGLLRRKLQLRVSGQKLMRLASELLP